MMVARAFLSLIPRSWKNARVAFSCSLHPLQINLVSLGFSGATSRIAVFDVGSSRMILNGGLFTEGEGNTEGSVAELVVTVAKRGRVTVKKFCTSFN
jgi:hypothetical protein